MKFLVWFAVVIFMIATNVRLGVAEAEITNLRTQLSSNR